jgi:heat shock protein HslJ
MTFHNKFAKGFAMAVLFMIALAACSPTGSDGEPEPGVDLTDTSWVLNEFGAEDSLTAVLPNTTITLNFTDGQISGTSGCNSYFGDVTVKAETISISQIGSTMMACLDEGVMAQEAEYTAALTEVTSYTLAENQLTLQYEGGVLIFEGEE